jgi:hypothetical protein
MENSSIINECQQYKFPKRQKSSRKVQFENPHEIFTLKDLNATGSILRPLSSYHEGHGVSSTTGCFPHWHSVSFSN